VARKPPGSLDLPPSSLHSVDADAPANSPANNASRVRVRSERIFRPADYVSVGFLYVLRITAFLYFMWYWCSSDRWWSDPWQVAIAFLVTLGFAGSQLRWSALPLMARPIPMPEVAHLRVAVVTTCVPSVEPVAMIGRTLQALVSLDYPHDTWLLDEGDHPELRRLCERLGVYHASRKHQPHRQQAKGRYASHSKHGNYNVWLDEIGYAGYDVLIAFDPDHVPVPRFASAVLGYFADPSVAYVQTPQAYHNQSAAMIARGAAEETYEYYSAGQMASFGVGSPVITGCHCAHRLSALKAVGGFPDHQAEDILLTKMYKTGGWRGIYVPEVLATGQAPETWPAYLSQQGRWTRALLDIKIRRLAGFRKLGLTSRLLGYLQGFGGLSDAVLAAGALLVVGSTLATGGGQAAIGRFDTPQVAFAVACLAVSNVYRWRFYLPPAQTPGPHWRAAILRLAKWPYVFRALWLVLRDAPFPYIVTPKTGAHSGERALLIPHLAIVMFLGLSLIGGIATHHWSGMGECVWGASFGLFSMYMIGIDLFSSPRPPGSRG
jgi:cellulose synthase (UDP-forming)